MTSIRNLELPSRIMRPTLQTKGELGFIGDRYFVGRLDFASATVDWMVERSPAGLPGARVHVNGLWVNDAATVLVELLIDGEPQLIARDADNGEVLWTKSLAHSAAKFETYHFLASDRPHLVLCTQYVGFRSEVTDGGGTRTTVSPELGCYVETRCFDPQSGDELYFQSHDDRFVSALDRYEFGGLWVRGSIVESLDFETGASQRIWESAHNIDTAVFSFNSLWAAWHHRGQVGVERIVNGERISEAQWPHARVKDTRLHSTEGGIGLQVNDQSLAWLGQHPSMAWQATAKPWIYNVHSAVDSPYVFVGTDGRGGYLYGFDECGTEVLKLRPTMGGFGDLSHLPDHRKLVAGFFTTRSYKKRPSLLVLSIDDLRQETLPECGSVLGSWIRGVVCRHDTQLAIVEF